MLEREALAWERQHLDVDGCQRALGSSEAAASGQSETVEKESKAPPLGLPARRDEFPLSAFLKTGDGSGGEGGERRRTGACLPELVREELLHRFVMGEFTTERQFSCRMRSAPKYATRGIKVHSIRPVLIFAEMRASMSLPVRGCRAVGGVSSTSAGEGAVVRPNDA